MHALKAASLVLLLTLGPETATAQDIAAGERAFAKCRACHQLGEGARNLVGPELNGLFGRKAGTVEGYSYSAANTESGIVWDEAKFAEYIQNPRGVIPGTKMVFPGLRNAREIADLTAYLRQFDAKGARR